MNQQSKTPYFLWFIPLIALVVVSQLYLLLPVTAVLSRYLNVTPIQASGLSTVFSIGYAVGVLVWGVLSDKYGRQRILMLGMSSLLLATLIMTQLTTWSGFMLLRSIQGFFAAAFAPVIMVWLAENVALPRRLTVIGYLSCAFLLAGVLGQSVGAWLIVDGVNSVMWLYAGCYVVALAVVMRLPDQPRRPDQATIKLGDLIKALPSLLAHPKLRALYLTSLLLLWTFVALYVWLTQQDGPRLSLMGLSVAGLRTIAIPAMLLTLSSMWLSRRFGAQRVVLVTLAVMLLTLPLHYVAVQALWPSTLMVGHFVYVAALAYCVPCLIVAIGGHAQTIRTAKLSNVQGSALSLYAFLLFVGTSLGAYFVNVLPIEWLLGGLMVGMAVSAYWLYRGLKP
ncbi:MAG: MFS transporter [Neisseriaceae bacterium]|nr:MFS transporter [Neisseriaceae bacterium]